MQPRPETGAKYAAGRASGFGLRGKGFGLRGKGCGLRGKGCGLRVCELMIWAPDLGPGSPLRFGGLRFASRAGGDWLNFA